MTKEIKTEKPDINKQYTADEMAARFKRFNDEMAELHRQPKRLVVSIKPEGKKKVRFNIPWHRVKVTRYGGIKLFGKAVKRITQDKTRGYYVWMERHYD